MQRETELPCWRTETGVGRDGRGPVVDSIHAAMSWCRSWRRLRTQVNPGLVGCYEGKCGRIEG